MKSEFQFQQVSNGNSVLQLSRPSKSGDRTHTFAFENQYLYKQKALLETKAEEALAQKQRFQALYLDILKKNDQIVQKAVNLQCAPLRQQLASLNKQFSLLQKQHHQTVSQFANEKKQVQRVFKAKLDQLLIQNQQLQSKLNKQITENQQLKLHFQALNKSFNQQAIRFQQNINRLQQAFQAKLQKQADSSKKAEQTHSNELTVLKASNQKQIQRMKNQFQEFHKNQLKPLQKQLKENSQAARKYQAEKQMMNQKILNLEKLISHRENQLHYVKKQLSRTCFKLLVFKLSSAALQEKLRTSTQLVLSGQKQFEMLQKRILSQQQRQRRSREQIELVRTGFLQALEETKRQLNL